MISRGFSVHIASTVMLGAIGMFRRTVGRSAPGVLEVGRILFLFLMITAITIISVPVTAYAQDNGYVQVRGAKLYYSKVGKGIPLVVLHDIPGLSDDYLHPQMDSLLGNSVRLIFYDQRASGQSTGEADTSHLSMHQFVEDLESFRVAMNIDRLNLMGHGFGGLLAMYYASTYPTHVASLILLNPEPASWMERTPYESRIVSARITPDDSARIAAIESRPGWQQDPGAVEADLRLWFRTYFYNPSMVNELSLHLDSTSLARLTITSRLLRTGLGHYDIRDQLAQVTAPTLILQGDAGVFSVSGAMTIRRQIPNARLFVLHNTGHFAFIEAPDWFRNLVLEFLVAHGEAEQVSGT